jgi:hypothetical protein
MESMRYVGTNASYARGGDRTNASYVRGDRTNAFDVRGDRALVELMRYAS